MLGTYQVTKSVDCTLFNGVMDNICNYYYDTSTTVITNHLKVPLL